MSSSGQAGSRSLHWLACLEALAVQMRLSCSTVRHCTKSLDFDTTTERPSMATCISNGSMPLALQAASSEGLMGRLASAMSSSPRQNLARPAPEPPPPTTMLAPMARPYSSAKASAMGRTVEEPAWFRVTRLPDGAAGGVLAGAVEEPV